MANLLQAGQRFGKLTVIKVSDNKRSWSPLDYECLCDCGNTTLATDKQLTNTSANSKKSCGCLAREFRHADKPLLKKNNPRIYKIWTNMRQRCFNSNDSNFHNYGGRGITVCKEWDNDFSAFLQWALSNGYDKKLSIDRIGVNGNYEPTNCRWATQEQQCRNTRVNHNITYNGETKTMQDWAEELGFKPVTLKLRLMRGATIEQAFFKPQRKSPTNRKVLITD